MKCEEICHLFARVSGPYKMSNYEVVIASPTHSDQHPKAHEVRRNLATFSREYLSLAKLIRDW